MALPIPVPPPVMIASLDMGIYSGCVIVVRLHINWGVL